MAKKKTINVDKLLDERDLAEVEGFKDSAVFDWKEEDEAREWVDDMQRAGYVVYDTGGAEDVFVLWAFKKGIKLRGKHTSRAG